MRLSAADKLILISILLLFLCCFAVLLYVRYSNEESRLDTEVREILAAAHVSADSLDSYMRRVAVRDSLLREEIKRGKR
jgi:Ca2+/Na+ antiporter